jgi:hypothetical protein
MLDLRAPQDGDVEQGRAGKLNNHPGKEIPGWLVAVIAVAIIVIGCLFRS